MSDRTDLNALREQARHSHTTAAFNEAWYLALPVEVSRGDLLALVEAVEAAHRVAGWGWGADAPEDAIRDFKAMAFALLRFDFGAA